jgi:hypothetical protein
MHCINPQHLVKISALNMMSRHSGDAAAAIKSKTKLLEKCLPVNKTQLAIVCVPCCCTLNKTFSERMVNDRSTVGGDNHNPDINVDG